MAYMSRQQAFKLAKPALQNIQILSYKAYCSDNGLDYRYNESLAKYNDAVQSCVGGSMKSGFFKVGSHPYYGNESYIREQINSLTSKYNQSHELASSFDYYEVKKILGTVDNEKDSGMLTEQQAVENLSGKDTSSTDTQVKKETTSAVSYIIDKIVPISTPTTDTSTSTDTPTSTLTDNSAFKYFNIDPTNATPILGGTHIVSESTETSTKRIETLGNAGDGSISPTMDTSAGGAFYLGATPSSDVNTPNYKNMTKEEIAETHREKRQKYIDNINVLSEIIVGKNVNQILDDKLDSIKRNYGIDISAIIGAADKNEEATKEARNAIRSFMYAKFTDENQRMIQDAIKDTKGKLMDMVDNQLGKQIVEPGREINKDVQNFSSKLEMLSKLSDIDMANKISQGLQDTILNASGVGGFIDKLTGLDKEIAGYGVTTNFGGAFTGVLGDFTGGIAGGVQEGISKEIKIITPEVTKIAKQVEQAEKALEAFEDQVKGMIDAAEQMATEMLKELEGQLIEDVVKSVKIDFGGISF